MPGDLEAVAEAGERADQRRAEGEAEGDVADGERDVEGHAADEDDGELVAVAAAERRPRGDVEQDARQVAADATRRRERHAPQAPARERAQRRARHARHTPDAHLPRRPPPLAEEKRRRQGADRADGEAGRGAQYEAAEEDDVERRLDAGDGREGDAAQRGQRGQRGDEREDAAGGMSALVPGEAREQRGAEHDERAELPADHEGTSTVRRARSCAAPSSGSSAVPRMRAVSVAKY